MINLAVLPDDGRRVARCFTDPQFRGFNCTAEPTRRACERDRADEPPEPAWPTTDQYALARRCPRCHTAAGQECTWKQPRGRRFHLARVDAGVRHYRRDVGAAPWREDREPGRCYCTIDPCPMETRA